MAKIARKDVKIFASTAGATGVTEFKTTSQTTPTYSTNPDIIQNTAWEDGWLSGSNVIPYAEDMNAVQYVTSYHLAYLMQQGIPEWSANTVYYTGSFCQVSGDIYKCLNDNISGTIPTSDVTNWVKLDTTPVTAVNLGSGEGLFYQKNANGELEMKGLAVVGGTISSTDTTVIIDFSGGGGISTVWGTIGGTVTDQTDLVNYISGLLANTYQNSASAVPATNNTYNLGSSTYKFLNGYISTINTDALKSANAAINIYNNLLPSATGTYDLGSSTYTYQTGYIDTLYAKTLTSVNAQINLGIDLIPSNNNAYKLGSSANAFSNGYFKALTLNGNDLATTLSNLTVTATSPISVSSGNISISKATSSADGYLSSTDWTTFNSKQNALSAATASNDGYLTSADWTTFNGKQAAINSNNRLSASYVSGLGSCATLGYDNSTIKVSGGNLYVNGKQNTLNGTGFVKASGTTISYDNSTYFKTSGGTISGATTFSANVTTNYIIVNQETQFQNSSVNYKGHIGEDSNGRFYLRNGSSGGRYLAQNGTTWTEYSDRRLKKNIIDLEESLDKILELKPVKYDYSTDEGNNSERIGFIAQDVYEVIPEAVDGKPEDEGYMGLSQEVLIPYLVKAIQELSAKVDELERQLY